MLIFRSVFIVLGLTLGLFPVLSAGGAPVILVLGDSLSAGYGLPSGAEWPALLQYKLASEGHPHRVVNASISGETSSGGLHRLTELLEKHQPALVVIELGANDGLRGLSLKALRGNLEQMVIQSRAAGAQVIVCGMRIPGNYGKPYAEAFHKLYAEVAHAHETELVPFLLEGVALEPELFQEDGLHPTAEAQPVILENVWSVAKDILSARQ